MLALLVGTGVYLTVILGLPQLRYFFLMFKEVFGNLGSKKEGRAPYHPSRPFPRPWPPRSAPATSRASPRLFTSAAPELSSGCSCPPSSA